MTEPHLPQHLVWQTLILSGRPHPLTMVQVERLCAVYYKQAQTDFIEIPQ